MAELYDAYKKALMATFELNHNAWSDSDEALRKACPNLFTAIATCPVKGCYWSQTTLNNVVMHLNDHHKWPRTELDAQRLQDPEMGEPVYVRNIADWLDEYATVNNVNLSFKTPEQVEEERQTRLKQNTERREAKKKMMALVYDPELGGPGYKVNEGVIEFDAHDVTINYKDITSITYVYFDGEEKGEIV